jgi:mannose-6-phosphate isomerase-like protein (cupin superfamily)
MKITTYNEFGWNFNKSENVDIGYTKKLTYKGFDLIHAKVKPKEELKMHYHDRNGGDELFCFYKGGHFKIKTKSEEKEFNTSEPVYVSFSDSEAHAVENLSDEILEFQAVYSPCFVPGEVKQD